MEDNFYYDNIGSIIAFRRKIYPELEYYTPRKYDSLSRYDSTERLLDNLNGVYYHKTYEPVEIPLSDGDTFVTVDVQTENRLDIIANNIYGYAPYWWIIAFANNVIDPFNVPLGTVLRCPPLMSIYGKGSVIK